MEHHALRKDMTCLNCNHVVEKRFCPNCGQENTHTKESFHYLFTHTIEDIVHYDSGFWKIIKYLLFYPAKLTIEYLSGKRKTYVAPVKLYIFISFITFFLLSVLPVFKSDKEILKVTDSNNAPLEKDVKLSEVPIFGDYKNIYTLDSIQKTLPKDKKATGLNYWLKHKIAKINEENTILEFKEKFKKSLFQNIPKALFLYMPIFAFVLWLFHGKKRWYYFEHGIYTIHYFSMLLLSFTIFIILSWLFSFLGKNSFTETFLVITLFTMILWWIFYFFRSHSRFYREQKWVSRLKGVCIFSINLFFLLITLLFLITYSALNVN